jgi:hypothetical protein
VYGVQARLIVAFTLLGALVAGALAGAAGREYRAHAYVIRVPPAYSNTAGLALARAKAPRAKVQLTGRGDFAITVRASSEGEAVTLATGYAKAIKRSLRRVPGLATRGRGARHAARELGPLGWALLGGFAGLWLGVAAEIVRSGSGRAPRRAGAPCAPATRATPG